MLTVWFLTGLWHGASWNFVLWGLFYGVILAVEKKIILPLKEKTNKTLNSVISYAAMFFITITGWTVFYFTDLESLNTVILGMYGFGGLPFGDVFANSVIEENILLLPLAAAAALPIFPKVSSFAKNKLKILNNVTVWIKTAYSAFLLFVSTAMLASGSYNPFLYFRF